MEKTAKLREQILKLSWPNILANLIIPLAGIVDVAFLGHVQNLEVLTGVGLANILFDLIFFSLAFLRMSTTGPTAEAFGAQQSQSLKDILIYQMKTALGIGLALLILHQWLLPLGLSFLNGSQGEKEIALSYMEIRIWGTPLALALMVFQGWWLGIQKIQHVLALSFLLNGCNILLDFLFIGHLHLQETGAALATLLSVLLSFGYCLYHTRHLFRISAFFQSTNQQNPKGMRSLQTNLFLRTLVLIGTFSLFNHWNAGLGSNQFATVTILMKCLLLGSFISDGFAFALETLAGKFKGEKRTELYPALLRETAKPLLLFLALFSILFAGFQNQIAGLFTSHPSVVQLFKAQYPLMLLCLSLASGAYLFDGFYLGLSEGVKLRNSLVIASLVGFLPIAWMGFYQKSETLLWLGMAGFMLVRTTVLAGFFARSQRVQTPGEKDPHTL